VWPLLVVVGDDFLDDVPQVLLAENDKVIEALRLNRLREFLRANALSDIVEGCEALHGLI
jgi:hypothetical protein